MDVLPDELGANIAESGKLPTTFRPPFDLSERFPILKPKVSIALHPEPVSNPLPVTASKIGGHFYWPVAEEWPNCLRPHYDFDSDDSGDGSSDGGLLLEDLSIHYMKPVIQLKKEDVPSVKFPPGKDLFQMLWCTGCHEDNHDPDVVEPMVYWRKMNSKEKLRDSNETASPSDNGETVAMRMECSISPEYIVEYPS